VHHTSLLIVFKNTIYRSEEKERKKRKRKKLYKKEKKKGHVRIYREGIIIEYDRVKSISYKLELPAIIKISPPPPPPHEPSSAELCKQTHKSSLSCGRK